MHAELCPVCNGNGLVPGGFYNCIIRNDYEDDSISLSSKTTEECRACRGKGYLLLNDNVQVNVVKKKEY